MSHTLPATGTSEVTGVVTGIEIEWNIEVPDNTSAWVTLPDRSRELFEAGRYSFVLDDADE